jgi:hypothetical protein
MDQPNPGLLSLLEYRLKAIATGHLALRYAMEWDVVPSIEIYFNGKQVVEGTATAFTNGAIESAIIHSRVLLEFLGLKIDGQAKLTQIERRKTDDQAIEQFIGLSKLSIERAVNPYPGPKEEAERALAHVIHLANKGLAHNTSSFTNRNDEGAKLLEIAFRGVPKLMANYFYLPLGIESPEFEIQYRKSQQVDEARPLSPDEYRARRADEAKP